MQSIIEIAGLAKTYATGFEALKTINLDIKQGEIFALLGPNGAGKTTLISIICGIVTKSTGSVRIGGHDNVLEPRKARELVGLVPQELSTDAFETVFDTVSFSRGLFGKPAAPAFIDKLLTDLSLIDKRDGKIMTLSGGMKRRVMIAKALSHDPELLFLDEPTAGVDVELRRDMWRQIGALRDAGTTIILTTHYIEEAQEMADRVGVINKGKLLLVDEKDAIMAKLGSTEARISLVEPLSALPAPLSGYPVSIESDGRTLLYRGGDGTGKGKREAAELVKALVDLGIAFEGIETRESSLEDIFVDLVENGEVAA